MIEDNDRLAPPGAGIPWAERNLIGAGIRLAARVATKDRLTGLFRTEAQRAIDAARLVSEHDGRRRVLVRRPPGTEDSSRDWSVYMVLEHLVIVNSAIALTVPRLYAGRGVSTEVRADAVRPVVEAGPEQMDDLAKLVERYTDLVEKLGNLRAGIAHPHPWYGPLSAAQWHTLAVVHNAVHRRHIERIVQTLQA